MGPGTMKVADGTRFLFHHTDSRIRIWQKYYECMHPSFQMTALQISAGRFMVWGVFSSNMISPLISMDTNLISSLHLNITTFPVYTLIAIMFPYEDGHIQRDNAP